MKTNFTIYLIKRRISVCPERNLILLSFGMHLRKYHHPPPPPLQLYTKMPKKWKVISVSLALRLIKETSFFNTRCANPRKFYGVKKNSITPPPPKKKKRP